MECVHRSFTIGAVILAMSLSEGLMPILMLLAFYGLSASYGAVCIDVLSAKSSKMQAQCGLLPGQQ